MTDRVLRGVSFHSSREGTRCTSRYSSDPGDRNGDYGFRVVVNGRGREIPRRVIRGGSWDNIHSGLRSAYHYSCNPVLRGIIHLGFRVVTSRVRGKK